MSEPARILVIDDEEAIRKTVSLTLRHEGYSVDTADDGKEAIAKSKTSFYNLALIDIRLGDMDGTDLLSALKQTTPKMVKIILTGYPNLQNAVKAINNGIDAYLIKPVNTHEMLRVIREQLDKQKQQRQYDQQKLAEYVETRVRALDAESGGG